MSCAARRIEELQPARPDLADKMERLRATLTHHGASKVYDARPAPMIDLPPDPRRRSELTSKDTLLL